MSKFIILLINIYQKLPFRSHSSCKFLPTCSQYTKEAVTKYGSFKGVYLGLRRIGRCHPWSKGRYDPVK